MTTVHVAAGVVVNPQGHILVAKRPKDKHQGGLWEFPGGKIENGETAHHALVRELSEEVGLRITQSEPLLTVKHAYPDKTVCLHVLRTTQFEGAAWGKEGQEIAWVQPAALLNLSFPAANTPIVAAARLPRHVMITGKFTSESEFMQRVQQGLDRGAGLVQFRAPWLSGDVYTELANKAHRVCEAAGVPLMVHSSLDVYSAVQCEGMHLSSAALHVCSERPLPRQYWLSAACHTLDEVEKAQRLGVDFVYVSPVQTTTSHPGTPALGWERLAAITCEAALPIYALGGLDVSDVSTAIAHGAQGIAGISAFWRDL